MTDYCWVPYCTKKHHIPDGAFCVGRDKDGSEIFVGLSKVCGDELPCKIVPNRHEAYVSHRGREIKVDDAQILVQHPCRSRTHGRTLLWIHESRGKIPFGAVPGGRTARGEPLFIGRAKHAVGILREVDVVGKVHPSHGVLYFPYGGKEISHSCYEVLVHA